MPLLINNLGPLGLIWDQKWKREMLFAQNLGKCVNGAGGLCNYVKFPSAFRPNLPICPTSSYPFFPLQLTL